MSATKSPEEVIDERWIDEKLSAYVIGTHPTVRHDEASGLARDMRQRFDEWASQQPSYTVSLAFSKRLAPDESVSKHLAERYVRTMCSAGTQMKRGSADPVQLEFRINGVSLRHPKLSVVSGVFSGPDLTLRKLRQMDGRTNLKKAGRPAEVRLGGEVFIP